MALGWDNEAVATRWNIATQTKLETVLVMVGLTACKQRSETSEMPVVENIQHRATLEYYLRDADTGGVGVTPLKILRPLGDAADILGSQSCHQKKMWCRIGHQGLMHSLKNMVLFSM